MKVTLGLWEAQTAPRPVKQNLQGWGPSGPRYLLESWVVPVCSQSGGAQLCAFPAAPATGEVRPQHSPAPSCSSFFEGVQWRALRHILRGWRLRAQDPGSARIASAPDPPPGHSTHRRSSRDKVRGRGWGGGQGRRRWQARAPRTPQLLPQASRAPALLEMLQLSFLWAAGRRQQGRCLLLWRARAQQSRDAARWHQSTLQRR